MNSTDFKKELKNTFKDNPYEMLYTGSSYVDILGMVSNTHKEDGIISVEYVERGEQLNDVLDNIETVNHEVREMYENVLRHGNLYRVEVELFGTQANAGYFVSFIQNGKMAIGYLIDLAGYPMGIHLGIGVYLTMLSKQLKALDSVFEVGVFGEVFLCAKDGDVNGSVIDAMATVLNMNGVDASFSVSEEDDENEFFELFLGLRDGLSTPPDLGVCRDYCSVALELMEGM